MSDVLMAFIAAAVLIAFPVGCWLIDDWLAGRRNVSPAEAERRRRAALTRVSGGGGWRRR